MKDLECSTKLSVFFLAKESCQRVNKTICAYSKLLFFVFDFYPNKTSNGFLLSRDYLEYVLYVIKYALGRKTDKNSFA